MTVIRMKKKMPGSQNGLSVQMFNKDDEHTVGETITEYLAELFLKCSAAVVVAGAPVIVEPPNVQSKEGPPEIKEELTQESVTADVITKMTRPELEAMINVNDALSDIDPNIFKRKSDLVSEIIKTLDLE